MTYLDEVGLLDYFDQIISTAMVPHGKPMPDVYQYACKCIGEKPEAWHCTGRFTEWADGGLSGRMSADHGAGSVTAG